MIILVNAWKTNFIIKNNDFLNKKAEKNLDFEKNSIGNMAKIA